MRRKRSLTGTVTDSTGGVLPGVTVTAVHEATGNRFTAVTDERGIYRIPVRVGVYQLTAELQGFTTVNRTGVELLAGQTASIDLQLSPSTVQETVTVTAEAPLLDVTTSSLGGNVDPRQVQELPVQRPQLDGARAAGAGQPHDRHQPDHAAARSEQRRGREFQLNVDGQQVSADIGTGDQPRYSQDSIAEFQFISNRFDATQGRSSGVQVNVDHQVGHEQLSGLFRGNFRDDNFNAENPVARPRGADRQPADQHGHRRAARRRTSCTTSATSSTSASRGAGSGTRRIQSSTWS